MNIQIVYSLLYYLVLPGHRRLLMLCTIQLLLSSVPRAFEDIMFYYTYTPDKTVRAVKPGVFFSDERVNIEYVRITEK